MTTYQLMKQFMTRMVNPSKRPSRLRRAIPLLLACSAWSASPYATLAAQQEPVDAAAVAKIRDEAFNRSQVMTLMSYLTDVHGPRLTGSPIARRAADYTMTQLKGWGLANTHLESFPFGRGWTNDKFYAQVTAPVAFAVIGYPQAWTPGTSGALKSDIVYVRIDNESDFAKYKGQLAGKIVMLAPMRPVEPNYAPFASRRTDDALARMAEAPMPTPAAVAPRQSGPRTAADSIAQRQVQLQQAVAVRRRAFIDDEKVGAILEPGRGDGGTVFTPNGASRDPEHPATTPVITVAIEHYGRILRTLEKNIAVTMELDVRNTFYDADLTSFNIIAEIPGTDAKLKDEVVMLGAHFDSWHAGTGATDNAAGSAAMLEAVRILTATGLKPKRTIRLALWTGEEQGLIGSRAWVKAHFGSRDSLTAAAEKFSAYFNLDNGTGAIRGVFEQGNAAAAPIFSAWMKPFEDKGVKTLTLANTGGTDHLSFDGIGLPGFQFIQDDIEYGTRTHHSNMDTYERVQDADMKLNAAVIASFVYHAANRTARFPRKVPASP